jgi:hypothetical protein
MAVLADHGPGPLSIDSKYFPNLKGPVWAVLAIGAGVAGSYLATSPLLTEEGPAPAEGEGGPGDIASPNGTREAESTTTA